MSMPGIGSQPIGIATGQVQQVYGGSMGGLVAGALGPDLGSGGWEFTAEEMDSVIKKWEGLLDDIKDDRRKIRDMRQYGTNQPSEDQPTTNYWQRLLEGVNALEDSNKSMLSYVQDYTDRLKKAKADLEESDDAAARSVRSTEA